MHGAHPEDKIGGAELQSWLLARGLGARHQAVFLAIRSNVTEHQTSKSDGVEIVKLPSKKKFSWREYLSVYASVRKLCPDVIHLRMFDYILPFSVISKLLRVPLVYHVSHELDCTPFRDGDFTKPRKRLRDMINFLFMKRVQGLICQTNDQVRLLGPSKTPRIVISNSAAASTGRTSEKDERLVLWVGNIKPIKQPLIFVDLAESLKDSGLEFLMVGYPQDEQLARKLRDKAAQLKHLQYIPGVPFREVEAYYRKASVLVSTSSGEGFPNTFIQAMQAATPIVSLTVNPDEMLTEYQVGYCSGSEEQLRQDLISSLSNPALLGKMRKNTQVCLKEKFNITANARALEEFVLALMSNRARRH